MPLFTILIGTRGSPRIAMEVTAPDAATAHNQAFDLRESADERVEVVSLPDEAELLAADVAANVDKARRFHERNDQCAMSLQVQFMRECGAI